MADQFVVVTTYRPKSKGKAIVHAWGPYAGRGEAEAGRQRMIREGRGYPGVLQVSNCLVMSPDAPPQEG